MTMASSAIPKLSSGDFVYLVYITMDQVKKEINEPGNKPEAVETPKEAGQPENDDKMRPQDQEDAVGKIREAFRAAGKAPGALW